MKLGTLVHLTTAEEAYSKFKFLREHGFEACQLVYKPRKYDVKDAETIKKAAAETGVDISAQFCGYYDNHTVWDNYYGFLTSGINIEAYRKERVEYVMDAADFAKALGITDIVIHAGFVPNNPFSPEYASMLAGVELISEKCGQNGLNLLFETGGEAPIVLLRLIEDIGRNNLFINLDPANILMYGYGNPVDAVRVFGKYVRNIHGKDGMLPTTPKKIGEETKVGEGLVDFRKMLGLLKELGYDRYIIIEREISGSKQTEDIIAAKHYFEKLISEIY